MTVAAVPGAPPLPRNRFKRVLGHPDSLVGILADGMKSHKRRCLEPLLCGDSSKMHQDPKTVAILFAPHTQQLTILDITHMSTPHLMTFPRNADGAPWNCHCCNPAGICRLDQGAAGSEDPDRPENKLKCPANGRAPPGPTGRLLPKAWPPPPRWVTKLHKNNAAYDF